MPLPLPPGFLGRGSYGAVYDHNLFSTGSKLYRNWAPSVRQHMLPENCNVDKNDDLVALDVGSRWLSSLAFKDMSNPEAFRDELVACVQLSKLLRVHSAVGTSTLPLDAPAAAAGRAATANKRALPFPTLSWCSQDSGPRSGHQDSGKRIPRSLIPFRTRSLIPFRLCNMDALKFFVKGGVSVDDLMTLLTTFCEFCDAVHAGGYCHADVKLENILVQLGPSSAAVPTFLIHDFGLTGTARRTLNHKVVGTPLFCSVLFDTGDEVAETIKFKHWHRVYGDDAKYKAVLKSCGTQESKHPLFRAVDFHAMAHSLMDLGQLSHWAFIPTVKDFLLGAVRILLVDSPATTAQLVMHKLQDAYFRKVQRNWPSSQRAWVDLGRPAVLVHPVTSTRAQAGPSTRAQAGGRYVESRLSLVGSTRRPPPDQTAAAIGAAVFEQLRRAETLPVRAAPLPVRPFSARESMTGSAESAGYADVVARARARVVPVLLPLVQQVQGDELFADDQAILDLAKDLGGGDAAVEKAVAMVNQEASKLWKQLPEQGASPPRSSRASPPRSSRASTPRSSRASTPRSSRPSTTRRSRASTTQRGTLQQSNPSQHYSTLPPYPPHTNNGPE
jgi:hypothetical protein